MNRKLLSLIESGSSSDIKDYVGEYAMAAMADMGMKHLSWVLGAMGDRYAGAEVLGYGPSYGSGQSVVHFRLK